MISKNDAELSVVGQGELLSVPRSTAYYELVAVTDEILEICRAINEIHTRRPFWGSRRIVDELAKNSLLVNRKCVQRLMRAMGVTASYPKPRTSRSGFGPGHKIYPYLLNDVEVSRANQAWVTDIMFIPMAAGFAYLVAIMDLYSRRILSWRLSNTPNARFCIGAFQEALDVHGKPEMLNTDQGSQFTSLAFTGVLEANGLRISMDGNGRWIDKAWASYCTSG